MASDLKWRTGFDWGAIVLVASAGLVAWLAAGLVRWLAATIALAAAAYMVHWYRKWNRPGWQQVHFRAMLAYAGIAAREHAIARQAARDFDRRAACTQLGLLLCGDDNRAAVNAMISDLAHLQGAFLAGLVERHAMEVLPGAPFELRRDLSARLRGVRFGPQLMIAAVVENIYGGPEAARYAVALATGDAR
jgi:hypothetical protein